MIVIGVGATSYTTVARNGRNTDRASELQKLANALEEYRADHGLYIESGGGTGYWGGTSHAEFEGAGVDCANPSQGERFCCLVGGSIASNFDDEILDGSGNIIGYWYCPEPYNVYIGSDVSLRKDPFETHTADSIYHYASDGKTFALVARHYEGTPPDGHRLSESMFYYCNAKSFQAGFNWDTTYAVFSPEIRQPTVTEATGHTVPCP